MNLLLGLLVVLPAQPPTAPAPRLVEPTIHNLTFTYSGQVAKTPVLEMAAKDGRVEVRWTSEKTAYRAVATTAVFRDGVLSLAGTENVPAVLVGPSAQMSGLRIDASLEAGTVTVQGAGLIKMTP